MELFSRTLVVTLSMEYNEDMMSDYMERVPENVHLDAHFKVRASRTIAKTSVFRDIPNATQDEWF